MELGTSNSLYCPTRFIIIASHLRPSSLVVEPSPEFPHRSLAADYPLFHLHHFQTVTLIVSDYVVVDVALGSSSNSPSYILARYQARRPLIIYLKSCNTPWGNWLDWANIACDAWERIEFFVCSIISFAIVRTFTFINDQTISSPSKY